MRKRGYVRRRRTYYSKSGRKIKKILKSQRGWGNSVEQGFARGFKRIFG